MTWTLWRGDDLLGALHARSVKSPEPAKDDRHQVNAVLVPDPVRLPLPSVSQHVRERAGRRTVTEHIREPRVAAVRPRPSGQALGVWVVPPGPSEPQPGVPPDGELRVRDEGGRIVPTRSIGVLEFRPDAAHLPPELATFPEGAFVGGSVWLVNFTHDSPR